MTRQKEDSSITGQDRKEYGIRTPGGETHAENSNHYEFMEPEDDAGLCPLFALPGWPDIVEKYRDVSPADFVLRFGGKKAAGDRNPWPVRDLAEQLHCYPRAAAKLGPLHKSGMIYLREPLEQASGYAAAVFRVREWRPAENYPLIGDITGGLGMDTAAWARTGARVCYCERDKKLAMIARHNHRVLGVDDRVTHFFGDGIKWLENRVKAGEPPLDLLYIDPSRRTDSTKSIHRSKANRRVITLEESEPPVPEIMPLIRSSARQYLLKLSPMLDITHLKQKLPGLYRLMAVSVTGEVKELLAWGWGDGLEEGKNPDETGSVSREAVLLDRSGEVIFRMTTGTRNTQGKRSGAETRKMPGTEPSGPFLFEPDPAILKMDLAGELASRLDLRFANRATGYLTGDRQLSGFPGRVYRIRETHPWNPKKIKRMLKAKGIRRVHIHQRGFQLSVDQLFKVLQCEMGEDAHLIATQDHQGRPVLHVADMS